MEINKFTSGKDGILKSSYNKQGKQVFLPNNNFKSNNMINAVINLVAYSLGILTAVYSPELVETVSKFLR